MLDRIGVSFSDGASFVATPLLVARRLESTPDFTAGKHIRHIAVRTRSETEILSVRPNEESEQDCKCV